jgi:hypothetical protein
VASRFSHLNKSYNLPPDVHGEGVSFLNIGSPKLQNLHVGKFISDLIELPDISWRVKQERTRFDLDELFKDDRHVNFLLNVTSGLGHDAVDVGHDGDGPVVAGRSLPQILF